MENKTTPNRAFIKKTQTNLPAELSGKIPPQSLEAERAVIGAMMLQKDAVADVIDILNEESFYDPRHQTIYKAIKDLFGHSKPIDLISIHDTLQRNGEISIAGGVSYLTELVNSVSSSAHVEYYARIISEKHIKRELIRMSSKIIEKSYDETSDVFDVLNEAEAHLFQIAENNMSRSVDNMHDVVTEAITEIEKASQNKTGISGVPTGFSALDRITAGWQNSDMIVIAARPAMGKTAFVLSMARNIAVDYNMGVAIFSLEMSSVQLVKRLISAEARIPAEKLRKGDLADHEFQQLHSRISKLSTAPIFIDDTPGLSVFDLRAKCRRLKMDPKKNLSIVIIDYLQLMSAGGSSKGGNREQEISTISRSIKEIAKELNVPVIALSQLSRSVEQRGGDKRPILSDLRESGAIEQDADIVSFIYRPEYYGFIQDEDGNSNLGVGEIIIAKHRNGALENVRLRFVKEYARFENIESAIDYHEGNHFSGSLPQGDSFDNNQTITLKSKINQDVNDIDFNPIDDNGTPF